MTIFPGVSEIFGGFFWLYIFIMNWLGRRKGAESVSLLSRMMKSSTVAARALLGRARGRRSLYPCEMHVFGLGRLPSPVEKKFIVANRIFFLHLYACSGYSSTTGRAALAVFGHRLDSSTKAGNCVHHFGGSYVLGGSREAKFRLSYWKDCMTQGDEFLAIELLLKSRVVEIIPPRT
jgi:hypothetical protein